MPGWRGAAANHEIGSDPFARGRLTVHHPQHLLDATLAEADEILAHGGERRHLIRRSGNVVESDERDVAGDVDPEFGERREHPHGHEIVSGEDRRRQLVRPGDEMVIPHRLKPVVPLGTFH